MTKKQKLLRKLLSGSKNIRFDEFVSLLLAFGFELKRISGSHQIYKHPQAPHLLSLQPDQNKQAKQYQIRQFLKLIEEYNLNLENDPEDKDDESEDE
jgi:predicted RNA binding protein YcfA (HicA-like mRNA interferase family)